MAGPPASPISPRKTSSNIKKCANNGHVDPNIAHVPKRNTNPGLRVIGGRIYDSALGKTCHQCRQKTMDFTAACANLRNGKPCPIMYCHKCLINRYGEKAEEVAKVENWGCPKCRGVCNCSCCMKKKGQSPTGILVHAAKKTGCSSVLELLNRKESGAIGTENIVLERSPNSKKGSLATAINSVKERNHDVEMTDSALPTRKTKKYSKKNKAESGTVDALECNEKIASDFAENGVLPDSKKRKGSAVVDCDNAKAKQPKVPKMKQTDKLKDDSISKPLDLNAESKQPKVRKLKQQPADKQTETSIGKLFDLNSSPEVDPGNQPETGLLNDGSNDKPLPKVCKPKKQNTVCPSEPEIEVVLPQGTTLRTVASVEFEEKDVGPALQFLEFCNAFSKVLGLKKGQAEALLRELARERAGFRGVSQIVQFHIKLLAIIQEDIGEKPLSCKRGIEKSWLQTLSKCRRFTECTANELRLDFLTEGPSAYDDWDTSTKLKLLNLLCDETLCTGKLRNWIDKEYTKFRESRKEVSEKVLAARKKEKELKKQLKDDVAKEMISSKCDGAPLTIRQHDVLISKIKSETEKAHAEMLESLNLLPKKKQMPSVVRTEAVLLRESGHAYWKLRGYGSSNILLQDIEKWDVIVPSEKWFIYDEEEERIIEKLVSSRQTKPKQHKILEGKPLDVGRTVQENDAMETEPL